MIFGNKNEAPAQPKSSVERTSDTATAIGMPEAKTDISGSTAYLGQIAAENTIAAQTGEGGFIGAIPEELRPPSGGDAVHEPGDGNDRRAPIAVSPAVAGSAINSPLNPATESVQAYTDGLSRPTDNTL